MGESFKKHPITGMAVDPIHVGTGGGRLGRVNQSIVRDPVPQVPKIPGSSLAGVYRAYAAMAKGKYPDCAGQGQPDQQGNGGHCGHPTVPSVPCSVSLGAREADSPDGPLLATRRCCSFQWRRARVRSGSPVQERRGSSGPR